jgi:hypothetical protein
MTRERPYGEAASSQVALDAVRAQRGPAFRRAPSISSSSASACIRWGRWSNSIPARWRWSSRRTASGGSAAGDDPARARQEAQQYPHTLDLLYDRASATGAPYAIVRALPPGAFGVDPSEFYLA